MASRSLGTLTVDLIAKIGGFKAGMDQAERSAEKASRKIIAEKNAMAKKLDSIYSGISTGAVAAFSAIGVAAGIAVTAITNSVKEGVEYADKFDEISARLQLDVEKLQELNFAGSLSGVDLGELEGALPKLSKAMQDSTEKGSHFQELFASLGVSAIDPTTGKLKDTITFFKELADVFASFDEPVAEASLAMDLFGKSGAGMLELLNRGSEGINALGQRARDLGLILDEETTSSIANMKDNVDILKTSFTIFGAQLASELSPVIINLTNYFVEWNRTGEGTKQVIDVLNTIINTLNATLGACEIAWNSLSSVIGAVINVIGGLINQVGLAVDAFATFTNALYNFNFREASASIREFVEKSLTNFANTAEFTGQVVNESFDGIVAGAQRMSNGLNASVNVAAGSLKNLQNQAAQTAQFVGNIAQRVNAQTLSSILQQNSQTDSKPKATGGGGGGGGKTRGTVRVSSAPANDQTSKVAQLTSQYTTLMDSMNKRIALVGQESKVAELSYDLQYGSLRNLNSEQKQNLLNTAQMLEAKENEIELNKEAAQAQQALNDQQNDQMKKNQDMLEQIRLQRDMLGKTREEQEILMLEADGASKEVIEAMKEFQKARKAVNDLIEVSDQFRKSFSDAFLSVIDGSKSLKSALMDMFDEINRKILEMIVKNLTEKWFGQFGSGIGISPGSTGTRGGFFGNLFGSLFGVPSDMMKSTGGPLFSDILGGLFGGGRATGGQALPDTMYRVNENGPEMLTVKGKDYLMMGKSSGMITPNHLLKGSGGLSQNNQFIIQGKIDYRTQMQISQEVGRRAQLATTRNS